MRFSINVSDRFRTSLLVCATVYMAALSVMYAFEWDGCGALTLWPAWIWAVPGILLWALGFTRKRVKVIAAIGLLWVLFLAMFTEEAWYPLRAFRSCPDAKWQRVTADGNNALRVVSLNCCGGQYEAALEALPYVSDVLLLQEAPSGAEVERLARKLFGDGAGWLYGGDTCVIVRGKCLTGRQQARIVNPYTWSRVRLSTGMELEAISIHLLPPALRLDLWNPDCWKGTAALERGRRDQLQSLARRLQQLPPDAFVILGGDFNVPAGDGILRLLKPRLHDSFQTRGIGWGDTVLNELPISRFDQVWIGGRMQACGTRSVRTLHSDHRMVIADLVLTSRE